MAIEIAKTPTLRGKEAERFRRLSEQNTKKCADKKEVFQAVRAFLSISQNKHKTHFK
jgi:hypothetical protein